MSNTCYKLKAKKKLQIMWKYIPIKYQSQIMSNSFFFKFRRKKLLAWRSRKALTSLLCCAQLFIMSRWASSRDKKEPKKCYDLKRFKSKYKNLKLLFKKYKNMIGKKRYHTVTTNTLYLFIPSNNLNGIRKHCSCLCFSDTCNLMKRNCFLHYGW